MADDDILTGALLQEACLSVEELASACSVTTEWIVRHVEEGALTGQGASKDAGDAEGEARPVDPQGRDVEIEGFEPTTGEAHGQQPTQAVVGVHGDLEDVVEVVEAGEEVRYRLLETVRQFGRERLAQSGEMETLRRRHALFFLSLAEGITPELRDTHNLQWSAWLYRLDREQDNLRAALDWALETGEPEVGLRLAHALYGWWLGRGYWTEARRRLERPFVIAPGRDDRARQQPHAIAGDLPPAEFEASLPPRWAAAQQPSAAEINPTCP